MKMKWMKMVKPQTVLLSALLAGLLFNPLAQATEESTAQVKIPATAETIWQAIDKQTEELAQAIQTGKLGEVHHHASAIRDLVAALPAHSKKLPLDKAAQAKTNGQFVATLAERLDASGDANDKAATEANFQKIKNVLKTMRANHPGSTHTR